MITIAGVGECGTRRVRRAPSGCARLERRIELPASLEETFAFFADARNLERLTPAWIGFEILSPGPITMRAGTHIDYRIRIRGVPVHWTTEIVCWEPPHQFVDWQLRGPYRWWHHTHRFEACEGGTRMLDVVEIRTPLHGLMYPLFVRADVERIFEYRARQMRAIFGGEAPRDPA